MIIVSDAENDLNVDDEKIKELHGEASATRDTLMLQFVHFEATAKKMADLPDHRDVCRNVLIAAQLFLHKHMFTLQMLPKRESILNKRKSKCKEANSEQTSQPNIASSFKSMFANQVNSSNSIIDKPVLANYDALKSKLEILLEQDEQLRRFLQTAVDEDNEEEVDVLHKAISECEQEIFKLQSIIEKQ